VRSAGARHSYDGAPNPRSRAARKAAIAARKHHGCARKDYHRAGQPTDLRPSESAEEGTRSKHQAKSSERERSLLRGRNTCNHLRQLYRHQGRCTRAARRNRGRIKGGRGTRGEPRSRHGHHVVIGSSKRRHPNGNVDRGALRHRERRLGGRHRVRWSTPNSESQGAGSRSSGNGVARVDGGDAVRTGRQGTRRECCDA
jgi:hypothetical protein